MGISDRPCVDIPIHPAKWASPEETDTEKEFAIIELGHHEAWGGDTMNGTSTCSMNREMDKKMTLPVLETPFRLPPHVAILPSSLFLSDVLPITGHFAKVLINLYRGG